MTAHRQIPAHSRISRETIFYLSDPFLSICIWFPPYNTLTKLSHTGLPPNHVIGEGNKQMMVGGSHCLRESRLD